MTHILDHDEVAALLEVEAFSPSPGRRLLQGGALALFIAALGYLLTTVLESEQQPQAPLMSWQQGRLQPLDNPPLSRCLLRWGSARALPGPHHLLISQQADNWTLVWLSDEGSDNFTLPGKVRELCP
ncbi:MAG: hypothetical protein ACRCRW_16445 [Aeromonadaceae bacterium]